ncbi:hypothetical protein C1645_838019 [Glomus cerebriforme]|uniref:Uncharacterized protein n=1 Tax=Glomus cerebriforme TaxID=658196 RepID=A0A397S929_9GLOM|nr:hypothetical protein C1645_838019 [Glomus cerebriforme]
MSYLDHNNHVNNNNSMYRSNKPVTDIHHMTILPDLTFTCAVSPPLDDHLPTPISSILMNTSFTNDPLIKKSNKKKKKNSKQELPLVAPTKVISPHVLTDILIDVLKYANNPLEEFMPEDNNIKQSFSIPSEIMNITFNKIINKSIDMIVDQLDSTHLTDSLPNTLMDQLFTRYLMPLSSTSVLDKSHFFTPSHFTPANVDFSLRPLSFDTCIGV